MINLLKKYKNFIILASMFFFGLFIGVLGFRIYTISEEKSHIFSSILHDPTSGVFTNPILDCEFFQNDEFTSFRKLEYKINDLIEEEEKNKNVERVSVYFRDMNTGAWVGVNEKEEFSPASLLKVPVMMAYYKIAEKDPTILSKDLEFHSDDFASVSLTQNIVPTETLLEDQKYKVHDLISRMIINSDNQSQFLLINQLPQSDMETVYVDLGISIPGVRSTEDFMTVKEYASFFRILYNATYLTREYSEQALSLLSQVEYTSALRAGIPDDIVLSHKFGERGYTTEDGREIQQLHDCGIVYYPERPYLLCVMTRGEDLTRLSATIKKVSELVYHEVDSLPLK